MVIDFSRIGNPTALTAHLDGSYFSLEIEGSVIHGDAWTLASLASGAKGSISEHEVVYVGQAIGQRGKSNAWLRTKRHEKLQRIYADHVGEQWDIFVSPLRVEQTHMISDDHIDDCEDGPELSAFQNVFTDEGGRILKTSIDLIEHSLISYFQPEYNELLRSWDPTSPTQAMRKMRAAGIRLLAVELDGSEKLIRFSSQEQPEAVRSHYIFHDIPPLPKRPVLRRVSAEHLSDWRMSALLIRSGHQSVVTAAESSAIALTIFGDRAPTIRVPPEVDLRGRIDHNRQDRNEYPSSDPSRVWTEPISDSDPLSPPEYEQLVRGFAYSPYPTYESSGYIYVTERAFHSPFSWQVHSADMLSVASGLVAGRIDGSAPMLEQVVVEILRSRVFRVAVISESPDSPIIRATRPWTGSVFIPIQQQSSIVDAARSAVLTGYRLTSVAQRTGVSASSPGLMVIVESTDQLLRTEVGRELLLAMVTTPPSAQIGFQFLVTDIELLRAKTDLNARLLDLENLSIIAPSAEESRGTFLELTLAQRHPYYESSSGAPFEIIVLASESVACLGQIVAINMSAQHLDDAVEWAESLLADHVPYLVEFHGKDYGGWSRLNAITTHPWKVVRSSDGWLLIQQYARIGGGDVLARGFGSVLSWANDKLSRMMPINDDFPWAVCQAGPDGCFTAMVHLDGFPRWQKRAGAAIWRIDGSSRVTEVTPDRGE